MANTLTDEELLRLHTSQKSDETGGPSGLDIEGEMIRRGFIPKYAQEKFLVKRLDGSQTGPHDILEIKNLFNDGTINADSPVHVQSLFGWVPLRNVFEFEKWSEPSPTGSTSESMPPCGFQMFPLESTEESTLQSDPVHDAVKSQEIAETVEGGKKSEEVFRRKEKGISRLTFNLALLGVFIYGGWWGELPKSTHPMDKEVLGVMISASITTLIFLRSRNAGIAGIFTALWVVGLFLFGALGFLLTPNFGPPNQLLTIPLGIIAFLWALAPLVALSIINTNRFGKNKPHFNESRQSITQRRKGFGGGLVLFTVSHVVWLPLFLIATIHNRRFYGGSIGRVELTPWRHATEFQVSARSISNFNYFDDADFLLSASLCLFSIITAYRLVREKLDAIPLACMLCVYSFSILLLIGNLSGEQILGLILWSVAWFSYFGLSRRVKVTYTRAPETAQTA